MRQMDFMEESESSRMRMRFPHGSSFGLPKSWSNISKRVSKHHHAAKIDDHSSVSSEFLNFHFAKVDFRSWKSFTYSVAWMWRHALFLPSAITFYNMMIS